MSRELRTTVGQLGPIHLADTRGAVVQRLMAMMREAHAAGARFVVFPELALIPEPARRSRKRRSSKATNIIAANSSPLPPRS